MTAFLELNRKHPLAECESCPLMNEPCVPTSGPENAKVAVVSRSPGYYEAKKGQAFSGPSGKVLDHLLNENGVKREETLLTNVVLCTTKAPPLAAVKACSPRLQSELDSADTIIAAGSEAAKAIGGLTSLSGNRGYVHERHTDSGRSQRLVITNNPAVVLKEDGLFPNLVRDFKLALNPPDPPTLPKVTWTNDINTAREWLSDLRRRFLSPRFMETRESLSVDIETKGLRHTAPIVSIGFSIDGTKAVAIGEAVCSDTNTMQNYVRPILESGEVHCVWHNGKFDVRNLRDKRISAKVDDDTLLLSYACDERSDEEQVHSLDYLCMNELNWPNYEPDEVRNWKKKIGRLEKAGRYDELEQLETPEELYEYNALDAAGTAQLFPILRHRADSDGVLEYYRDYLLPDSNSIIDLELRGVPYDIHRAADINEAEVLPQLSTLREEMRLIVGDGNYNPASSQQNAALVYDQWQLVHNIDRGPDKERSVDKAVYTEIKEGRFVVSFADQGKGKDRAAHRKRIRETAIRWADRFAPFKELDKQRSTYIEGLILRAELAEGKIYTNFKFHSTVSGRSSSSGPNLQNITRTKEGLPNIRSLFVASEQCQILQADYSQAELRTIAKLSGNANLGDIYRQGVSLHKQVAERFYGKDYSYEQYVHAKNMDFGVAYGQGADTFQEKHDIPVEEGREFIDWWFKTFPEVRRWRQATAREVLANGYVQSPFGHKRRFYLITPENKGSVIREAINFRPQNIAARLTLYAVRKLVLLGLPVILTVHDSIILDSPKADLDKHAMIVKEVMEAAAVECLQWDDIPFEVDLQIGQNWGELEDYVSEPMPLAA
jgi:uracil-DNA glycosylase family 4